MKNCMPRVAGGAAANKIAHTLALRRSGFWVRASSAERQAGVLTNSCGGGGGGALL
jgi:hypothetical protein